MGGATIVPDLTVEALSPTNAAVLILPGGGTWLEAHHEPLVRKSEEFLHSGVPVAAIRGATMALANAGMLDNRWHTSNAPSVLTTQCPGYSGSSHYLSDPAVTDGDLITASGLAPVEFARDVLNRLKVFASATMNAWSQLHEIRTESAFSDLRDSLPPQDTAE